MDDDDNIALYEAVLLDSVTVRNIAYLRRLSALEPPGSSRRGGTPQNSVSGLSFVVSLAACNNRLHMSGAAKLWRSAVILRLRPSFAARSLVAKVCEGV